jgi:hypothetical protein
MPEARSLSASRSALLLDGEHAAWLTAFHGGDAVGDVVEFADGSDPIVRKRISSVQYTELELACGADMSAALLDWIRGSLARDFVVKNGAVSVSDRNLRELWRLEFVNARIAEVGFPALDAASKQQFEIGLSLAPELTRRTTKSGQRAAASPAKSQKALLAANFRLTIDGLDTSRVARIDPLAVRITAAAAETGEVRRVAAGPARVDVPNLVVSIGEAAAEGWWEWHDDFLIKGNNGPDRARQGTLELLSADRNSAVLTLTFGGLGLVSLAPAAIGAADALPFLRAEMYCEQINLE